MHLDTELRIEHDKVLLPFISLEREARTVVVIGMLHVASRVFFEDILSRLDAYESAGFQILYEDIESVPSTSQESLDHLINGLEAYGLYSQIRCIQPKTSWASADVSIEDMRENFPQEGDDDENMKDPKKYLHEILIPELQGIGPEIPNMGFVIDSRNESAVETILKYAEHGNVVTYWGCAHIPGIIHLLEQSSFSINSIEWVEAINLENLKKY